MSANPLRLMKRQYHRATAYGRFLRDFASFHRLSARAGRDLPFRWRPCLEDRTDTTPFDRHYTYHTAWAARLLAQLRPPRHVDIASSLMFVVNVSAFVPVDFYDYRPAPLTLSGVTCGAADLTSLPFEDGSISSLSCMHVVEHVGLGRYGDPLDPWGDRTAMRELHRVVARGGNLFFVVPVGRPRLYYNAHRVYGYEQVIENFPQMRVRQFALVPDRPEDGDLLVDANPEWVSRQRYGCGCFWLEKVL